MASWWMGEWAGERDRASDEEDFTRLVNINLHYSLLFSQLKNPWVDLCADYVQTSACSFWPLPPNYTAVGRAAAIYHLRFQRITSGHESKCCSLWPNSQGGSHRSKADLGYSAQLSEGQITHCDPEMLLCGHSVSKKTKLKEGGL